ncbi:MAG: hydrolase TatD [Gammaproteobacteria bacterium]|nr:hydrolase TatD [Gammaproteobacteria bacterium]
MELVDIGFNFTSSAFRKDADQVVKRAIQAGVKHFVLTGSDIEESEHAAELAAQYEGMVSTAGVHPHLAKQWQEDSCTKLKKLAVQRRVAAIGEAGLDYNRNYSTPEQQRIVFEAQLRLAVELKMPVFLHERDAHEDFAKILSKHRPNLSKVVVHCFTGTNEELDTYIELDCHIGITGWICDERRGHHLHKSIKNIPANRLMIETDAPYLLPRDLPKNKYPKPDGRRNEPAYLPHILTTVAKCRNVSVEQTAQETTLTAKDFFSIN